MKLIVLSNLLSTHHLLSHIFYFIKLNLLISPCGAFIMAKLDYRRAQEFAPTIVNLGQDYLVGSLHENSYSLSIIVFIACCLACPSCRLFCGSFQASVFSCHSFVRRSNFLRMMKWFVLLLWSVLSETIRVVLKVWILIMHLVCSNDRHPQ